MLPQTKPEEKIERDLSRTVLLKRTPEGLRVLLNGEPYDLTKSNLYNHAKLEFDLLLERSKQDDAQAAMHDHLLEMVALFVIEHHSGFSATYANTALNRLLKFEPLCPLTGDDAEWFDTGHDGLLQNKRCSRVFKHNGVAYDEEGVVFEDGKGRYLGAGSRVEIKKFPYVPRTVYVRVKPTNKVVGFCKDVWAKITGKDFSL